MWQTVDVLPSGLSVENRANPGEASSIARDFAAFLRNPSRINLVEVKDNLVGVAMAT
jgi:hypothetical protein